MRTTATSRVAPPDTASERTRDSPLPGRLLRRSSRASSRWVRCRRHRQRSACGWLVVQSAGVGVVSGMAWDLPGPSPLCRGTRRRTRRAGCGPGGTARCRRRHLGVTSRRPARPRGGVRGRSVLDAALETTAHPSIVRIAAGQRHIRAGRLRVEGLVARRPRRCWLRHRPPISGRVHRGHPIHHRAGTGGDAGAGRQPACRDDHCVDVHCSGGVDGERRPRTANRDRAASGRAWRTVDQLLST